MCGFFSLKNLMKHATTAQTAFFQQTQFYSQNAMDIKKYSNECGDGGDGGRAVKSDGEKGNEKIENEIVYLLLFWILKL